MKNCNLQSPGTKVSQLDTPAFIVDLDKMENNISNMAKYCKSKNINLRPHIKHHKTPEIALKQIQNGAIGICCQKLSEAEVMAQNDINNILITYEIVTEYKINRLMEICKIANLIVLVDNPKNIKDLDEATSHFNTNLGILLDINVGQNRCGIEPDSHLVKDLANQVLTAPGLQFKGIHGYAGSIQSIVNFEERKKADKESMHKSLIALEQLNDSKIPVEIVTAGGTGTYNLTTQYDHVTEIQPGSYVFMDNQYSAVLNDFEVAGTVLATVISKPTSGRAVLDSGMKSISTDQWPPKIKSHQGISVNTVSDEHLTINLDSEDSKNIKIGDQVELIPGHNDTTVNLHTNCFAIRNGIVQNVWPISAHAMTR
ncbi:MAG: DSD1 family PLP-dependent enzyme [SAR202 cluster bacterium]|nr:DSD1 family PLP-dependent enzyme [SAR202 cluster bacterium]|tara:strand:+ start:39519 stop:40628 length:1110 start_codon:yes stop_codon:yes gene_type:complete